jgi:hypothetical protein
MQYLSMTARGASDAEAVEAAGFCAEAGPAEDWSLEIATAKAAMTMSSQNLCLNICISPYSCESSGLEQSLCWGNSPSGLDGK